MKQALRAGALFAVVFLSQIINAQQTDWCRSDKQLKQRILSDPQMAAKWDQFVANAHSPLQQSSRATNETIYVPVVFHIVYDTDPIGSGENITDAQAISQIDALNRCYNFQDPDIANVPAPFQPLVANCNVHFCLAKFDESGNPTTGVIRHAYPNIPTWDSESDIDNTLKPVTIWDPSKYLNIWSVRMGGQLTTDGILAYSSIAGFTTSTDDGVVSRYTNIGTTNVVPLTYRKGKTIVHEVGHWLGLLHVWGFDASCGDAGDFIDDTPDQADMNFGCPPFPHITCNNGPNGDLFMDYMDYTDDNCADMFTIGQAARMHQSLDGVRASIKTAATSCFFNLDAAVLKIVLPADTVCSLSFKPVVIIKNQGTTTITSGKFYFQVDGNGVQIVNWSGSLGIQEETRVTLPLQTVSDGDHIFDVTFGNVNGQASDGFSGNDNLTTSFFAYDGGAAASLPFTQDFELAYPPLNWTNYNPNSDAVTWTWNTSIGGFGLSYSCASINNLGSAFNPIGRKDAFITESYDFSNIAYPELKFDVAYARNTAARSDSLNIYYSLDCGSNWQKVWNQSGAQLATAADKTTLFTPDPSQWKTVSIPLAAVGAQGKVSFKFENVSAWGNAMYIDNINVQNNPSLSVHDIQKQDIKVFPNPANNLVAVRLPANHSFQQMQLINNIGEVVYESAITDNSLVFEVGDFTNGLYLIHLKGANSTQTERLLISK
jgi:hypothetical protein